MRGGVATIFAGWPHRSHGFPFSGASPALRSMMSSNRCSHVAHTNTNIASVGGACLAARSSSVHADDAFTGLALPATLPIPGSAIW